MATKNYFRVTTFFFLFAISVLFLNCSKEQKKEVSKINDYKTFKSFFADSPSEYRSAPLWDWNEKITKEGIDFHLQKFKEGGLGGVFVHPRPGLLTEYISEDWHQLFDYTIQQGKKLGLLVWIYDENSYPSGFAGGHVPAAMPDSYLHATGLSCETHNILKADTTKFEAVFKVENNIVFDISATYQNELEKPGKYFLMKRTYARKSYWTGGFPYVDLLYKGVTEKFMEITMKGYEKYNRADFGVTLPGIFTDEPNLEAALGPNSLLRWTPDLYDEFKKRWKYELKPNLLSLIEEVGDWKKVRHDYYTVLLEMFINRWAKPWNKYCGENNLLWTGHYWEHGWPKPTHGFDEAAFYIYHQQPGVDMLGNELIPGGQGGQFGNTRAVKELMSSANQAGYNRTLSETYGGAGWEIDFSNFKRLVDWQGVLGVNFVNQHLSYYSIKGVRKFDYPPTFTYHEPWWKHYKPMGDYIGRISMAMSTGEQINHALVLQPNTTAWSYFSRSVKNPVVDTIQNNFKSFVYRLERNQYEYDLGSELVLRTIGSVKDGKMIVGHRTYDLIVIPETMNNLEDKTVEFLSKYLQQKGFILSFTKKIQYVDGKESALISDLMKKYINQWIFASTTEDVSVKKLFTYGNFSITEPEGFNGELYHQRRVVNDGEVLLFANSDTLNCAKATITGEGTSLLKMDLQTGSVTKMTQKPVNGLITFDISLAPVGSELYFLAKNEVNEPTDQPVVIGQQPIQAIGGITIKAESENVLVIDYLDLKSKNLNLTQTYFMQAMRQLYDSSGFIMGNPWQHKIQYKQDYLALDTFKVGSGFEVTYHFNIAKNSDLNALFSTDVIVERPELWDVYLNGEKINKSDRWWIDREFFRYPVGTLLQKGANTITLKAEKMSVHAELMPAYLVGNFILKPLKQGFEISNGSITGLGSWKTKGYPFYSQSVSYTQNFQLSQEDSKCKVQLKKWNGTMAVVFVNGTYAGLISYPPFELNITSLVKAGNNEIKVEVIGSLKNTFGYFYKNNKRWINGPGDWNTAPVSIPSLENYFIMDYGLMEPFMLVK